MYAALRGGLGNPRSAGSKDGFTVALQHADRACTLEVNFTCWETKPQDGPVLIDGKPVRLFKDSRAWTREVLYQLGLERPLAGR